MANDKQKYFLFLFPLFSTSSSSSSNTKKKKLQFFCFIDASNIFSQHLSREKTSKQKIEESTVFLLFYLFFCTFFVFFCLSKSQFVKNFRLNLQNSEHTNSRKGNRKGDERKNDKNNHSKLNVFPIFSVFLAFFTL